jgi:hypothetical protein
VTQPRLGERDDLPDALLEEGVDELVLVGEAAVDGADADAGAACDLVERHRQPALGERRVSGLEDPLAVALGIAAQGTVGGR